MEYLDIDVEIGQKDGHDYAVSVDSPEGQAEGRLHVPYDEAALENILLRLQHALLRSGGSSRRSLTEEEQAVQRFGSDLFDALMAGDVGILYANCRVRARREDKGLRLWLRIHAPELAALPWEYLYDKNEDGYICLSQHTLLVRSTDLPQPITPLAVRLPLRILAMIASPGDQEPVDVQSEQARLKEALTFLERMGLVKLTWLTRQTWQDIQEAMMRGPWHILHFIGHSAIDGTQGEGALALAHPEGNAHFVRAVQLSRLLANHDSLRLVVLNTPGGQNESQRAACFDIAATLTRRGMPGVLAMQREISDLAALELTRTFYEALARGLPVDAAVTEARFASNIKINNSLEWGTPVLYLRQPDGRLFDLPPNPTERPPTRELEIATQMPASRIEPTWARVEEDIPGGNPLPHPTGAGTDYSAAWSYPPTQVVETTSRPAPPSSDPAPPTMPGYLYSQQQGSYPGSSPAYPGSQPQGDFGAPPPMPPPQGSKGPGLPTFFSQKDRSSAPPIRPPELLQFTAFYPRQVPVEAWNTLLVYTHIAQVVQQVQTDAARFESELGKDRRESAGKASIPLLRGTTITIVPACPGVVFNPSWFSFTWAEDWHRTTFRFQASQALMGAAANGEITIFSGPLIIGTIKLAFLCDDPRMPARERVSDKEEKAQLYQQVFSSYSHQDSPVVLACRNTYKALGMDVLIDIDSLRSGQDFSSALMRLIDTSDIFQLFWSPRSAQSSWVRREWTYALQRGRGESFIRPVYWELPMIPPPPELEKLHFTYMPLPTLTTHAMPQGGGLSRLFKRKH